MFNITLWDDLLWGLGGNWLGPDGKANLTSSAAKKAMNIYRTIYKNKWTSPNSAEAEFSETNSALESGNAAFALQWSAAYAELTSPKLAPKIADKIGVAPIPGNPHSTHVHALAIALNKYARNKDAAEIWMKYLATPEGMDAYAKAGGIPSMPKVLSDNVSLNPAFAPIAEDVGKYGYSPPPLQWHLRCHDADGRGLEPRLGRHQRSRRSALRGQPEAAGSTRQEKVIRKRQSILDHDVGGNVYHMPVGVRRRSVPTGYTRWVLSAPLLLFLTLFAVLPVFYGLWVSLTDQTVLNSDIKPVGLANYAIVLTDKAFWSALWFTVWYTVLTTALVLITGFVLAVLANRRFPASAYCSLFCSCPS